MRARPRAAAFSASRPRVGRLAAAALLLSASFVLSRVLGVLRGAVIAAIFGNSRQVEAYFAAFRIPDTMFMLVSGGALASAFVPMFAGLLQEGDERDAWDMASTVLNTVAIALACMAVFAFALATPIMDVLASGFKPGERDLAVHLTRIMLLQPIFLGVAAVLGAVLQCHNRFTLTALAPLAYNVCIILGAWLFGAAHGTEALAWSVVVGAIAQVVILIPGLRFELRRSYSATLNWASSSAREVLRLFGPRVVGSAAFQVMLLITLFLASRLPQGALGAVNYSWPLIMFPIGALGTAAATAIFPTLSRLTAARERPAVAQTVNRALRLVLFLALPAAVGLIVLRRPVINLIYGHGNWTGTATEQTAFALLFYSLALAPLAAIEVLPRVFYAMRDTVTPVRIAIVAVTIDAILSVFFVSIMPRSSGQGGLALATAIASSIQAVWLALALERRLGGIGRQSLLLTVRDAGSASLIMGMLLYVLLDPLTAIFPQHGWGALVTVVVEVGIGLGAFGFVTFLLESPELWEVRGFLVRDK